MNDRGHRTCWLSATAIDISMSPIGTGLTIDDGWREVAQTALDFVKRFA
jgi:hypothetical protein